MPVETPQVFLLSDADEGLAVVVEISKQESIYTLKQRVQLRTGIPSTDLVLFLNGSKLEEEYRIRDMNLTGTTKLVWMDKRKRPILTML